MSYLKTSVLTHAQKVRRLYKAALRNLYSWHPDRAHLRYQCVLMRARFDEYKDIQDAIKAKQLLKEGQQELEDKMHPQPFKFTHSPGGVAHGRNAHVPDWVLDVWAPQEKAQFPKYFALREQRKKEYVERWKKQYEGTT